MSRKTVAARQKLWQALKPTAEKSGVIRVWNFQRNLDDAKALLSQGVPKLVKRYTKAAA